MQSISGKVCFALQQCSYSICMAFLNGHIPGARRRIQRESKKTWDKKQILPFHVRRPFIYFGEKNNLEKTSWKIIFERRRWPISSTKNHFGATKTPKACDSRAKSQGASLSFADDVWILSLSEDTSHTRLMPHFTCREQVLTWNTGRRMKGQDWSQGIHQSEFNGSSRDSWKYADFWHKRSQNNPSTWSSKKLRWKNHIAFPNL